jgi:glycogenin
METIMKRGFISILSTESYLPGLLVLHHSLIATGTRFPFMVLVTDNISRVALDQLDQNGIAYQAIDRLIVNPTSVDDTHRWYYNYAKLSVFGLLAFDKVVFLDADLLITANIDELFDAPHLSAVNAGGRLPELSEWRQFNSGVMVIEPNQDLFSDMLDKVGKIETGAPGGDQAFLHAYYPDWPSWTHLHLDHRYNLFQVHLDRYHALLGWTLDDVRIVHFIGVTKPWMRHSETNRFRALVRRLRVLRRSGPAGPLKLEAEARWQTIWSQVQSEQSLPHLYAGFCE